MTTSVTLLLTVASKPVRHVEVRLPVSDNKVSRYGGDGGSYDYPINDFISCCECQARAMLLINEESNSVFDCHIGALMTAIMAEVSESKILRPYKLDMSVDCFSYLLRADGFAAAEIAQMRPDIIRTIRELYSEPCTI